MQDSLKNYIYVSDEKINRLYPQISRPLLKKFAGELSLNINFGVIGGNAKGTIQPNEDRISKLKILVKFLEEAGDVGEIDTAASYMYFKGSLLMKWARIEDSKYDEIIFFTGSTEKTIIGLAGQSKHTHFPNNLVADNPGSATRLWSSSYPALMEILERSPQSPIQVPKDKLDPGLYGDARALRVVESAINTIKGPTQKVEFLAQRYLNGGMQYRQPHETQSWVLFGSPIYIAEII